MTKKNNLIQFKQAPLPFIGQKRMFLKHFEKILSEHIPNDGEDWVIIDAFGGSGLLSHTAKKLKPKARVIYNDFDEYSERVSHISDTNLLRKQIEQVIGDKVKNGKKIPSEIQKEIIETIQAFNGYIDLHCLTSWLLFSGAQEKTLDQFFLKTFYHHVPKSDYPLADEYLEGVEVINESFCKLLPKYKDNPKALFILDPPYLCTNQKAYKKESYFDLIDFLKLVNMARPPYIFFSSSKSEFVRFIDFILENSILNHQAFDNHQRISINTAISHCGLYEDNMVYKF